ncbi:MAG: hypothetical protein HZA04_01510 [Nitrospinae bacterium]|nr:hypothetical protein [Nitrospinota bacterium]
MFAPDKGLEPLKQGGFLCPFAVPPQSYGLNPAAIPVRYLCWFKAENFLMQRQGAKMDPVFAACDHSLDFSDCPIYIAGVPPL